jgi:hypothetical protein
MENKSGVINALCCKDSINNGNRLGNMKIIMTKILKFFFILGHYPLTLISMINFHTKCNAIIMNNLLCFYILPFMIQLVTS